jgi:hypothetical protein
VLADPSGPVTRPSDHEGPLKESITIITIRTLLSCNKSSGRDSGFALARPVLEWRTSRALACYMDVATDSKVHWLRIRKVS